jgi:hypothetical protein
MKMARDRMEKRDWEHLKSLDWNSEARNVLKAALKRDGVSYVQLRDGLSALGLEETEANLRNKINRGTFSAAFLLQCFAALGNSNIWLGNKYEALSKIDF